MTGNAEQRHDGTAVEPEPQMTAARARQMLQIERREREQACMAAIDAALKEYRCKLNIVELRVNGQLAELSVKPEALND